MPVSGGSLVLTANYQKLSTADTKGYNQLVIRMEDDAASNAALSTDGTNQHFYLKTDESLTLGPSAGTIKPTEVYIKGTAADVVYYVGIPV